MNTTHQHHVMHEVEPYPEGWRPPSGNGFKAAARSIALGVLASVAVLLMGGWLVHLEQTRLDVSHLAATERLRSHEILLAAAPKETLDLPHVIHGKRLFETACVACHKADGAGVEGLGKNITQSWFVAALDDEKLRTFLIKGRDITDLMNTTKNPMPPRGGRDDLTDADLADIVVYLRGLQDPRRMPELPASALIAAPIAPPTEDEKAQALAAAGGDEELAEYIASGAKLFGSTCIACHGKGGVGVTNNGKALAANEFVKSLDDNALLAFIKKGRDPSDPKNTTGVGMPPKGGNPALSDDDLLDIIAYIRSLEGSPLATSGGK